MQVTVLGANATSCGRVAYTTFGVVLVKNVGAWGRAATAAPGCALLLAADLRTAPAAAPMATTRLMRRRRLIISTL